MTKQSALHSPLFLAHNKLDDLLWQLKQHGYRVVGPQAIDGSIVYQDLTSAKQLPWGLQDSQQAGSYQLKPLNIKRAFAFSVASQGIKPWLFKPEETVWRVKRNADGQLKFMPHIVEEAPIAFFGARDCDLRALAIQDQVFIENDHPEKSYQKRRQSLFLIAIDCGYSSENCFCLSAGGSPKVEQPSDITMTEVDNGFVIRSLSEHGQQIITPLKLKKATQIQQQASDKEVAQAKAMQQKRMPKDNQAVLNDILFANLDHPEWDEVARNCLSCGNCTSSCPTCFCHTEIEKPDLDGNGSSHLRQWDSCFNAGHSYFSKQVLRHDTKSRYKQWLTHKVGSWHQQFGSSGCVGCGRCIAWCPTGIDLTASLAAITGESNKREANESVK